MKRSGGKLLNSNFSHIYAERSVFTHPRTEYILRMFDNSRLVEIKHYKDIFSRKGQEFHIQKQSPKLIIARGSPPFLYKGSERCQSFGNRHFFYASPVINCPYNCGYCYLQGKYPSSNLLVFVNLEDTFETIDRLLKRHPLYISISYDTDLLALESIIHFVEAWLDFTCTRHDLLIEIRTKSVNISSLMKRKPVPNAVFAWTVSPAKIAMDYEKGAPTPAERLKAAKKLMDKGWNVRICFDPVLFVPDWKKVYLDCIQETFKILNASELKDISLGVFRIGCGYLKQAREKNPWSPLLSYPFVKEGDAYTYPGSLRDEMMRFLCEELERHVPLKKCYLQE